MSNGNDDIPPLPPEDGGYAPGERGMPLGSGRPAVAAAPGKMIFILIAAAIFIFIVVKALFFGSHGTVEVATNTVIKPPQPNEISSGPLVQPPPIVPKQEVFPPPPPFEPPKINPGTIVIGNTHPNEELLNQRKRSQMIVSSSSIASKLLGGKKAAPVPGSDPNAAFAQSVVDNSDAAHAEATRIGNLGITIAQGKMIHAILETAINTDLPGPIRAVVSHDTYGESGREVLIPKGSRLVGVYNTGIRRGQSRVFIIWTRVIRPDGVDVMINSPGTDALGRAGLQGDVDNKYFEMFTTALLTSTLDIGVAGIGQGLFGDQQTTSTVGSGGITTSSSPTSAAMQEAVQNLGSVGQAIVNSTLNLAPNVTIDQGTPVNVFVNRDLSFPTSVTGQGRFVD